jgi:hypothetical protein
MREVAAVFGLGRFGWPRLLAIGQMDSRGRLSYIISLILRFHTVSKSITIKNDLDKFLLWDSRPRLSRNPTQPKGFCTTMVSSRSGPTETIWMGTPTRSSTRFR